MKLTELIAGDFFLPPEWNREFNHIVTDSRDVQKGDLFIARRGLHAHGDEYIKAAVDNGAVAVLAEGDMGFRCESSPHFPMVPVFFAPEVGSHLQQWLYRRYDPSAMQLIAVTGTNGKSSVTQYIAQLAELCGVPCGVLGTLGNGRWGNLQPTRNTTADLAVILRQLEQLQQQGVNLVALEVSSHGLQQERVAGLSFAASVLTNITQDHLDYHGSMEHYIAAKRRLFTDYAATHALINTDGEYGRLLAAEKNLPAPALTYGHDTDAQIRYQLLALDMQGMHAELTTPWGVAQLILPLIGEFNLANVCAAITVLTWQGLDFNNLCATASRLQAVDGRMELYVKDNAPLVVVDFAHTPDALRNVLEALRPWQRPLTTVFGCGGERDRSKRPLMAAVVKELSQQVWLTDDNPRAEDPQQIFNDALAGVSGINSEHDRRQAIVTALAATTADGIVLIAGKGHENYQEIAGVKHPYRDADVLLAQGYQRAGAQHA